MIVNSKFEPEKLMIKARAVRTGNGSLTITSLQNAKRIKDEKTKGPEEIN